jgi:hypothetical protein
LQYTYKLSSGESSKHIFSGALWPENNHRCILNRLLLNELKIEFKLRVSFSASSTCTEVESAIDEIAAAVYFSHNTLQDLL